jgi:hypothetical protein
MKNFNVRSLAREFPAVKVGGKLTMHIDLDPGALIAVPNESEMVVRCRSGTLWITQLDNYRDLVVAAGESMAIGKGRDTLIRAVTAASVELDPAGIEHGRLTMDFMQGCCALKTALMKEAVKVKGNCRIRMAGNGLALCVQ